MCRMVCHHSCRGECLVDERSHQCLHLLDQKAILQREVDSGQREIQRQATNDTKATNQKTEYQQAQKAYIQGNYEEAAT